MGYLALYASIELSDGNVYRLAMEGLPAAPSSPIREKFVYNQSALYNFNKNNEKNQ